MYTYIAMNVNNQIWQLFLDVIIIYKNPHGGTKI
jgi:hypothetical protein